MRKACHCSAVEFGDFLKGALSWSKVWNLLAKMHSFRLRYVVLGLLVYLQNAFCQSCGPKFDDISSKAYLADIVIRGTVLHTNHTGLPLTLPVEVTIEKTFKGEHLLVKRRRRRYQNIMLQSFVSPDTAEECISINNVTLDSSSSYLFFISSHFVTESHHQRHKGIRVYNISAVPESDSKKNERSVRKILCDTCGKLHLGSYFV